MSVMTDGAERDQKTRQNKYMASPPNTDSIVRSRLLGAAFRSVVPVLLETEEPTCGHQHNNSTTCSYLYMADKMNLHYLIIYVLTYFTDTKCGVGT